MDEVDLRYFEGKFFGLHHLLDRYEMHLWQLDGRLSGLHYLLDGDEMYLWDLDGSLDGFSLAHVHLLDLDWRVVHGLRDDVHSVDDVSLDDGLHDVRGVEEDWGFELHRLDVEDVGVDDLHGLDLDWLEDLCWA